MGGVRRTRRRRTAARAGPAERLAGIIRILERRDSSGAALFEETRTRVRAADGFEARHVECLQSPCRVRSTRTDFRDLRRFRSTKISRTRCEETAALWWSNRERAEAPLRIIVEVGQPNTQNRAGREGEALLPIAPASRGISPSRQIASYVTRFRIRAASIMKDPHDVLFALFGVVLPPSCCWLGTLDVAEASPAFRASRRRETTGLIPSAAKFKNVTATCATSDP